MSDRVFWVFKCGEGRGSRNETWYLTCSSSSTMQASLCHIHKPSALAISKHKRLSEEWLTWSSSHHLSYPRHLLNKFRSLSLSYCLSAFQSHHQDPEYRYTFKLRFLSFIGHNVISYHVFTSTFSEVFRWSFACVAQKISILESPTSPSSPSNSSVHSLIHAHSCDAPTGYPSQ